MRRCPLSQPHPTRGSPALLDQSGTAVIGNNEPRRFLGRAATPKAGAGGGEAGKAQWGWRGDGDHVMALPVHRAVFWDEFPTGFFCYFGCRSQEHPQEGRALLVERSRMRPASPHLELQRKEGGRKEGSLSQTDTRVQSIRILLCFNLCGRRHMQRWFCSCSGGSRRAARCTSAQHSGCSFQHFQSLCWECAAAQHQGCWARRAVKASPARPIHNDCCFLALQCKTVLSSFLRSCDEDRNEAVRPKG